MIFCVEDDDAIRGLMIYTLIFVNHQQIKHILTRCMILHNILNQYRSHLCKEFINDAV